MKCTYEVCVKMGDYGICKNLVRCEGEGSVTRCLAVESAASVSVSEGVGYVRCVARLSTVALKRRLWDGRVKKMLVRVWQEFVGVKWVWVRVYLLGVRQDCRWWHMKEVCEKGE